MVRDALYDVRSKWEDIGIELLDKNEIDAVKKEKGNNLVDCLTEMLSIYLKRVTPKPSWRSIIAALKAKAVGELQRAQELEACLRQRNLFEPQTSICHSVRCIDESGESNVSQETSKEVAFPYLDTNNLNPNQRKDLIQKLSRDYKNILERFATLQNSTCESLCKQDISAEKIANCALSLALYKSDDVPRPLSQAEQERLEEAKTVERVFIFLRKHKLISYFDYGILEHIIKIYGAEEDKQRLKDYVENFHKYCQRKVVEVPSMILECPQSTRKIFKVLMTADMTVTLIDIKAAERKIADILGLPHSVLTLHEIAPGSVVLTLSIPIQSSNDIFPLQASQLNQLKANGFIIILDTITMEQSCMLMTCIIVNIKEWG